MHFWPNLSITKAKDSLGNFRGNRPKGLKDEEWNVLVSEERMNKLIAINKVPKASKRAGGPSRADKE